MRIDLLLPLLASIALTSVAYAERPSQPSSVMCIVVLDDQGIAVAGATVEIDCYDRPPSVKGTTDTNGCFRYQDHVRGGLACEVTKSGYYKTAGELWSGPSSAGMVPPVNAYTVVLKRIANPVPMQFKIVMARMPAGQDHVGFDLEVGDWVGPHGKGTRADMIVAMLYTDPGGKNYEKIQQFTFPNPLDGVIVLPGGPGGSLAVRSRLPVPQVAPAAGFTNELQQLQSRRTGGDPIDTTDPDSVCLFRVRTTTNSMSNIVQANVGWIENGFNLSGPEKELRFMYYYNPDPQSRSLEPEKIAKRQAGP